MVYDKNTVKIYIDNIKITANQLLHDIDDTFTFREDNISDYKLHLDIIENNLKYLRRNLLG